MKRYPLVFISLLTSCAVIAAAFMPSGTTANATPTFTEIVTEKPESVIESPVFVNEPAISANGAAETFYDELTDPTFAGYPETDHSTEPDEADVEMLARLIWGEARGIPSTMEKAAVVWCVLNRVDDPRWPDTVAEVITQPRQFVGYSPDYPVTDEHRAIAADVLSRWQLEKIGIGEAGRVLPADYFFFTGDGTHNLFRPEFESGTRWKWALNNPYEN